MNRNKPPKGYDENPEWTQQDFAKAKPASEALPKQAAAALLKNKGGRPKGSDKEQVSLRLDREALNHSRWRPRLADTDQRGDPEGGGGCRSARPGADWDVVYLVWWHCIPGVPRNSLGELVEFTLITGFMQRRQGDHRDP